MYRLWIGDEDFGTAAERPAHMWLKLLRERGEAARIEPVADDAPTFLSERTNVSDNEPRSGE